MKKPVLLLLKMRTRSEICGLIGIGKTKFYRDCKAMEKQGIVVPKGRLLSPSEQLAIFNFYDFGPILFE